MPTALKLSLQSLCAVLVAASLTAPTHGQHYPSGPIRIVVPFTPGSASDILARSIAQPLNTTWGQPVIVDNRPGAGGTIGTAITAKAAPNGHTLVVVSAGHVVNPVLFPGLSYDALKDFAGVTPLASLPSLMVVASGTQARTPRDLVSHARARTDGLTYVSGGIGSGSHVSAVKFLIASGIAATHVPLKGAGDMMTELMANRAQLGFLPIIAAASAIRDGKLNALAVSSPRRSAVFPNIPTLAEAGFPTAQFDFWIGLLAPVATPRSVVSTLNTEIARILQQPSVAQRLAQLGADPLPMTPEGFDQFMRREATELRKVLASDAASR